MQGLQYCGNEEGQGLTPGSVEEGVMRGLACLWGGRGGGMIVEGVCDSGAES